MEESSVALSTSEVCVPVWLEALAPPAHSCLPRVGVCTPPLLGPGQGTPHPSLLPGTPRRTRARPLAYPTDRREARGQHRPALANMTLTSVRSALDRVELRPTSPVTMPHSARTRLPPRGSPLMQIYG